MSLEDLQIVQDFIDYKLSDKKESKDNLFISSQTRGQAMKRLKEIVDEKITSSDLIFYIMQGFASASNPDTDFNTVVNHLKQYTKIQLFLILLKILETSSLSYGGERVEINARKTKEFLLHKFEQIENDISKDVEISLLKLLPEYTNMSVKDLNKMVSEYL